MVISRDRNARQNNNTIKVNKSAETVQELKCLGTTIKNKISIHEEIKSRPKSGSACYHSALNLLSSSLLSKSVE